MGIGFAGGWSGKICFIQAINLITHRKTYVHVFIYILSTVRMVIVIDLGHRGVMQKFLRIQEFSRLLALRVR